MTEPRRKLYQKVISDCFDCPHVHQWQWKCRKAKWRQLDSDEDIPSWCPLPNAEEEEDD